MKTLALALTLTLLALALAGCGSPLTDFTPSPGSNPTSQPLTLIQAANQDPAHVTPEEWAGEIEAINGQLQNEYRADWGENCLLVLLPPGQLPDPSRPALIATATFPNPAKEGDPRIGGYHLGRAAYVKSTFPGWRVAASHEVLELATDEAVNSPLANAARNVLGVIGREICDPVQAFSYSSAPGTGRPDDLSDYCLPDWFGGGAGGGVEWVGGKAVFDHLGVLGAAGELAPGGTAP